MGWLNLVAGTRDPRSAVLALGLLLAAVPAFAREMRPLVGQSAPEPSAPAPSVPPTSAPAQHPGNELELPRVSPEFAGIWGGHLFQMSSTGVGGVRAEPISLYFGQRSDGTVYFRTGLWGDPRNRTIQISAAVVNPKKIRITEEHLAPDGIHTLRVVQKRDLLLKAPGILDCLELVEVFGGAGDTGAFARPMATALLRGTLHVLDERQASELQSELIRSGAVEQGIVEDSRQF